MAGPRRRPCRVDRAASDQRDQERRKDFAPEIVRRRSNAGNGDAADAEQKWVAALARAVIPAAINAAPGLINAVRGRGKDAAAFPRLNRDTEGEEKWIGLAASVAASVLPQVISAIRNRPRTLRPRSCPPPHRPAMAMTLMRSRSGWPRWRALSSRPRSARPRGLINAVRGRGKDAAVAFSPATWQWSRRPRRSGSALPPALPPRSCRR